MMTQSNTKNLADRKLSRFRIGSLVFIVILTVIVFLLDQSMVHHRFFRGGWMSPSGVLRP
jgi:hypothetical protein